MKTITIDSQKYLLPTWEDLDNLCFEMSQKILKDQKSFDRLVTLIKGGLAFSRTMCDYLNIKNLSTLQISYYENIGQTKDKPQILQSLPIKITNEKILLFDDVVNSGESLKVCLDYLRLQNPASITIASLFLKEKSILKPDYFGALTDVWIIFPNETRETIALLTKTWLSSGKTQEEINQNLLSMNFSPPQLNYFLK